MARHTLSVRLSEAISEAQRERFIRSRFYRKQVDAGRMTLETAVKQLVRMQAAVEYLCQIRDMRYSDDFPSWKEIKVEL